MPDGTRAVALGLCALPLTAQAALLIGHADLPPTIPMQFDSGGAVWSMSTQVALFATAAIGLAGFVLLLSIRPIERHRSRLTAAGLSATVAPTLWCVGLVSGSGAIPPALTQVVGIGAVLVAVLLGLIPRRLAR